MNNKPAREQIVAALRCLDTNMPCRGCYYYTRSYCTSADALQQDAADMIEALVARIDELEANMEPVPAADLIDSGTDEWFGQTWTCGNCGTVMQLFDSNGCDPKPNYCPLCGYPFKKLREVANE